MFDAFHCEQQFVGMLLGLAAELAAVIAEDGQDRYAKRFVERRHAVVGVVRRGEGRLIS